MAWKPFQKEEKKAETPPTPPKDDQSALLDAFAARMDEKLAPLRETISTLESEWNGIKAEAEKSNTPPPEEITEDQRRLNAERALFAMNVSTRAMLVEQNCMNALSGDWSYLKPQLLDMFAKTANETKARPDYDKLCAEAVNMLVGREALKSGLRRDNSGKFFLEDASSKTGGPESPLNQFEPWITEDRTETAGDTLRKLNIDPEKFAQDLRDGRLH